MGLAISTFSIVRGLLGPWNTAAFMESSFLGQEVADENAGSWYLQELDGRLGAQDLLRSVARAKRRRRVRNGPPVDFHDAIDEIDDPVIVQTRASVQASFVLPVEGQARLRDLEDERGPRRVAVTVAPSVSPHDRNVRLGLRLVVELDGALRPYEPARPQRRPECVFHQADRGVVSAPLGLAHDELASEQLERLAREENADVDQAVVLGAGPAARADRIRRHEGDATSGGARRQRGGFRTTGRARGSGAALRLAVDRAAGSGPAGEADREMGDVREPHLTEHRSEERRVGKEWRSRRALERWRRKKQETRR